MTKTPFIGVSTSKRLRIRWMLFLFFSAQTIITLFSLAAAGKMKQTTEVKEGRSSACSGDHSLSLSLYPFSLILSDAFSQGPTQ